MKLFTQATLVVAMAISANAMAMQSLDDKDLSSTTGQDGITLTVNSGGVTINKLMIHDNDGLATGSTIGTTSLGGTGKAGAIVVNNVSVTPTDAAAPLATVKIDTDAGANNAAFLNVNAALGATKIDVANVKVAASNVYTAGKASRGVATTEYAVLDGSVAAPALSLTTGATTANIQLGNQPQGSLIKLDGQMTGGLTVNSLTLTDQANGGNVKLSGIHLASDNTDNLALNVDVGVTTGGLKVSGLSNSYNAYVEGVTLGTTPSIGSVEVKGLDLSKTTVLVSGH